MKAENVTIILPRFTHCEALNNYRQHFPVVDKLKSFASTTSIPDWMHYFSAKDSSALSVAALTGLADGLDTREGFWLRADPVDFQTDINSVYFYGIRHLDMNMMQVRCIADAIRPIIEDYGMELFTPKPYRWYLKCKQEVLLKTPAPETMMGESIREYLTEADVSWRKMFTEIQMTLKQCEVNQLLKREVTGLWFWGGGYFPNLPQLNFSKVYTDSPLAIGIAESQNIPTEEYEQEKVIDAKTIDNMFIAINELYGVQRDVLLPVYKMLRKRQLKQLSLYLGNEHMYVLKAQQIPAWWQFWKN